MPQSIPCGAVETLLVDGHNTAYLTPYRPGHQVAPRHLAYRVTRQWAFPVAGRIGYNSVVKCEVHAVHPTIHLPMPYEAAVAAVTTAFAGRGYQVVRSFDLQQAAAAHPLCSCAHHNTDLCTCQYLVLLAYVGQGSSPLAMSLHHNQGATLVTLVEGEEAAWLSAMLPLVSQKNTESVALQEESMQSKTFTVPNISCGHCTHAIQMEVGEIPGVKRVAAEVPSKQVVVDWDDPATWDQIKATLLEINYPPAE